MNIAVVGTGYVGLVTGTCLAETGNNVICVDIDNEKVEKMKAGEVPIYEPNLDVFFERNLKAGRLKFTTNLKEAVDHASVIFLALPTPPGGDGEADLSYVLGVANELGHIMEDYKVIVDKSTVPVGTADKVHATIAKNAKHKFDVVSNPEFLREGFAVSDFMKPDRIVIGTSSDTAQALMAALYKPYVRQGNPIIFMDEKSAELTKYAANSFLAVKITFMNEIANFCEKVGADVDKVRIGIGTDARIGKRFIFPGIGYGGSCFPKDVSALAKSGIEHGNAFQILESVMDVNNKQKTILVPKIKSYFGDDLKGKKFALWGLAFKPDTDDIREAPALYIIDELVKAGAEIVAHDPEAMENVQKVLGDKIVYSKDHYDTLKDADALIVATEWSLFRTPDFSKVAELLKEKVIFDGRNLYDLEEMRELGFYYASIGRNLVEG
ncbi:UDP-glucose/GDP-mannose dehydrogenase family protein [Flammeovirgaceae bacterium SG7u.111]|nr:UDP-glucose/GDP-mannose dehydrogenase family protein [Flammeovirgaceae bacterium SG7u.132]WPO34910.1 UDP-glucose/GDP-mannose dehydrogenase family protein [Flammeovirgaceae bacterium SG7u.111]